MKTQMKKERGPIVVPGNKNIEALHRTGAQGTIQGTDKDEEREERPEQQPASISAPRSPTVDPADPVATRRQGSDSKSHTPGPGDNLHRARA